MKRSFGIFILLLAFFAATCSHHNVPPTPPAPTPSAICGNGSCEEGETQTTCPADCGSPVPPPPPPPPVESKPTPKNHDREVFFGYYTDAFGTPFYDWDYDARKIHDSPYTGREAHGTTPYGNKGLYPWKFDPIRKVFLLGTWDETWWDGYRSYLYSGRKFDESRKFTILDDYWNHPWFEDHVVAKGRTSLPYHPFRNNDAGERFTDTRQLYNSWNGHSGCYSDDCFSWLAWNNDDSNLHIVNKKLPLALDAFFKRLASEARTVALSHCPTCYYPLRFYVIPLLEEWSVFDRATGKSVSGKNVGGDDRVLPWIEHYFLAAGFVPGPYFRYVPNRMSRYSDGSGFAYDQMGKTTVVAKYRSHNWLREVHSIDNAAEVAEFFSKTGIPREEVIISTDGADEGSDYLKRMSAIRAMNLPYFDEKMAGDLGAGTPIYRSGEARENFEKFFPLHVAGTFPK